MLRYKTETRPGLVALYDIRPGNGAGQFLQPWSLHGALLGPDTLCEPASRQLPAWTWIRPLDWTDNKRQKLKVYNDL